MTGSVGHGTTLDGVPLTVREITHTPVQNQLIATHARGSTWPHQTGLRGSPLLWPSAAKRSTIVDKFGRGRPINRTGRRLTAFR